MSIIFLLFVFSPRFYSMKPGALRAATIGRTDVDGGNLWYIRHHDKEQENAPILIVHGGDN
jgi:hypothetical protein